MISREEYLSSSRKVGNRLKEIRLQKGLIQMDIALATKLNRSYISRIEMGKARITFVLLERLIKSLQITSKDLLDY